MDLQNSFLLYRFNVFLKNFQIAPKNLARGEEMGLISKNIILIAVDEISKSLSFLRNPAKNLLKLNNDD